MEFPLSNYWKIENLFRSVSKVIVLFCLYITLVDPFLPCRCIVFVYLDKYSPLFVASFPLYFSASIKSMFIVSLSMHIWQLHMFEWTVVSWPFFLPPALWFSDPQLYWESACASMLDFSIIFTFSVMITSFYFNWKSTTRYILLYPSDQFLFHSASLYCLIPCSDLEKIYRHV